IEVSRKETDLSSSEEALVAWDWLVCEQLLGSQLKHGVSRLPSQSLIFPICKMEFPCMAVQFERGLSLCLIFILVKTYALQYGNFTGPNEDVLDLSENQIQGVPRKAFRGIADVKNL
ncbi:hypothetical protein STEG23_030519, partial [Scotinomys teguina]